MKQTVGWSLLTGEPVVFVEALPDRDSVVGTITHGDVLTASPSEYESRGHLVAADHLSVMRRIRRQEVRS